MNRVDYTSSDSSIPSPSSSEDSERCSKRGRLHLHHHTSDNSSKREKQRTSMRETKRMKSKDEDKKKMADEIDDDSGSGSLSRGDSEPGMTRVDPQAIVRYLLNELPNAGSDLKQLLQVIDGGKAVDINGIAQKSLIMHLRNLFLSLNLKELNHGAFVLPSNVRPTLEVIGSISLDSVAAPERRPIGPETPSAELLAASAKMKEAEAELEQDYGIFIGPPPPVVAAEAESANQADRFQEAGYKDHGIRG